MYWIGRGARRQYLDSPACRASPHTRRPSSTSPRLATRSGPEGEELVRVVAGDRRAHDADAVRDELGLDGESDRRQQPVEEADADQPHLRDGDDVDEAEAEEFAGDRLPRRREDEEPR